MTKQSSTSKKGNKIEIKLKLLSKDAVIPSYGHLSSVTNDGKGHITYMNDGDVGLDLTAISMEYDSDIDCYIYHTGLAIETDKHYGGFLFPRSSNRKKNCYLANSVGIVDTAIYRGEILICYKNRTSLESYAKTQGVNRFLGVIQEWLSNYTSARQTISKIFGLPKILARAIREKNDEEKRCWAHPEDFAPYKAGDKIAQLVIFPYSDVDINIVDALSDSSRGTGGFGSTDKKEKK